MKLGRLLLEGLEDELADRDFQHGGRHTRDFQHGRRHALAANSSSTLSPTKPKPIDDKPAELCRNLARNSFGKLIMMMFFKLLSWFLGEREFDNSYSM